MAAAILALAVALRFWRLTWGLDDTRGWFNEELVFTSPASRWVPLSWQSLDATSLLYPPLYSYLAGATTALAHGLGLQPNVGMFASGTVLTSRIPSALAGVATVWLVGRLARRFAGGGAEARRVGPLAALFLAVAPLHVMDSHRAGADVLLTFAVALTMATAWGLVVRGTPDRALLAGLAAGFALASKQTGLAMLAPVALACAEIAHRERSLAVLVGRLAWALFGLAIAWVVCCPPCWLHFDAFVAEIATHRQKLSLGQGSMNHLVPTLGRLGHPFLYEIGASLPYALGWPLYGLTVVGLGAALRRRDAGDRIALATLVPYFAVVGSAPVTFPRYLLPLFPGLAILAARTPVPRSAARRRAWEALVACAIVYTAALTITQVARFSTAQRREVAALAVESALARRPLATLAPPVHVAVPELVSGMDYFRLDTALLLAGATPVHLDPGRWFEKPVDAIVLPHWVSIWIRRDQPSPLLLRDLERLESGEAGYERVKRFGSWYLTNRWYTRLDPGFYGDLWQGDIGYDVYVRRSSEVGAPTSAP